MSPHLPNDKTLNTVIDGEPTCIPDVLLLDSVLKTVCLMKQG